MPNGQPNLNQFRSWVVSQYPNISSRQLEGLDDFITQQRAQMIAGYGVSPKDIPTGELGKQVLTQQLRAGTYKPEVTAVEQKESTSYKKMETLIARLENLHKEARKGIKFKKGVGARLKGYQLTIKGKLGYAPMAERYNRVRKGFTASLRSLTGDVGVLTEADYARIAALIPTLGDLPSEAEGGFKDLREQLKASYQQAGLEETSNPDPMGILGGGL